MFMKDCCMLAGRFAGLVVGVGLMLGTVPGGLVPARAQGDGAHDPQVQGDVHKVLDNKRYQAVNAAFHGDNVVLTGTVEVYADKEELDKKMHHVHHVQGVDNEVQVAGASVDDEALRTKLAKSLAYDRVGYGTTAFNDLTLAVNHGVVTLGGTVYGPLDKDSALTDVAYTPGVKDVIDNIQVAPVSPMDDRLRIELARAIYGTPQLQKYALDPQKPIRILVVNGNVTLSGVVDNKMDRDIAGMRANGVPGAFKVTNDLQVEGASSDK